MYIKRIEDGPMMANCYVVYDESKNGFMIDPVYPQGKIEKFIEDNNIKIDFILLTHTHFDHILGLNYFKNKYGVEVYAGEDSKDIANDPDYNLSRGFTDLEIEINKYLKDGEVFSKYNIKAIKTPGHSLDSMSYKLEDNIFSGDTLFRGSIGRSDFPGGSYNDLISSVINKLFIYDYDVNVYPGHGEQSQIGYERRNNPFFN